MDNSFVTSTVSLRTRWPLSLSFSDYIYYSNERFGSCYDTPVPVCDVDRSCYCNKVCHIRDRSAGGRRGGLRKCMVSDEGSKRCSFGGDEAEVLLSLLTEELGEECSDVRQENRRLIKMTVMEKKGNAETINRCKSKMKRVDFGVPKSESKFECESVVFRSREEDKSRREEMIRSKKDREDLQRKENLKAWKKEEEREVFLRKESGNARENEEKRETLLRKEIWKVRTRAREEERDDLLRREEHRERMRRDGSSCSSYDSLSSTGKYNSDTEIEGTGEGLGVELSNMYEKDSKRNDKIVSDEVGKEDYGVGMRKKHTKIGSYAGSSGAESDFRKKSEKKLTDVFIEETESRKEALQKDSSLLEVNESGYGKTSGSYKSYDDRKVKSTSGIKFDKERRQHQRQRGNEVIGQPETRIKYKQFTEMPESPNDEVVISYGSRKPNSGREEKSANVTSLSSEAKREHRTMVGLGTREDEYSRNTHKVSEALKVQEIDAKKASISQRLSETRMKKEEGCSTDVITSNDDAEMKQQSDQATMLKDKRRKSQQLTKKGSSSISTMQSDSRIIKQEENVNLMYGSFTESKDQHFQTHAENFGRTDVRIGAQQMTNEIFTHSGGLIGAKDGNKTRSETLMTPPSSQLAARDESHIESMSGLMFEEVPDGSLVSGSTALHKHVLGRSPSLHHEKYGGTKNDKANEQPSMFISNEDEIGSAEQLQKSSAHYVSEFAEKARHEISTSEIQEEKKTYESEFVREEEQSDRKSSSQYVSLESESEEHHSRHPSSGSKTKGPSDETWEVDEPSVQDHSKTGVQDDASKPENAIVKRAGRSLWNIIGDIVRLKWSTRSESHSTGGKSGGVSPNQSTSSNAWFSGHEAEEDGVSGRKEKMLTEEPASIHQKQKKTSTRSKEDSSSTLTVEAYAKPVGVDTLYSSTALESRSASMTISFPSIEETSKSNFEGSSSGAPVSESLIPLPAMRLRRSPIVKEIAEAAEAGSSCSDTSRQPVSTDLMEKSRPEVDEKLKQRKLQRKDQISKDRFDEWEEAYRVEAEQRKIDEMFMREALLEAKKAADNWEVPVGAVLVQGGKIIARGCNLVEELRDSTAHAEMICIRDASNVLRTWRLSETTLYVTLEPCPMCAGAILQARIDTVVWGAPNKLLGADGSWIRLLPSGDGGNGLEQMDKPAAPVHPFHPKITIRRGVLASECADAMQRFFQLRRREKEKKSEPPTPPSCLPISHRPTKFLTKMHDAFNIMFCL
ncbi:tRNA(adenine(34)) deaminase, chloroplastic [Olea europaea subsp. europaea]|uniref:tRNA(adenine(34)) deaminase n=1 Tax=Olea europaea subsp. europaea TaxID=158383 RepID=A0A8S0T332_OLEEU|nr:tRNA(adenine(34)) deaminase, chloroplastic [Olea europaea subsp. europaea]